MMWKRYPTNVDWPHVNRHARRRHRRSIRQWLRQWLPRMDLVLASWLDMEQMFDGEHATPTINDHGHQWRGVPVDMGRPKVSGKSADSADARPRAAVWRDAEQAVSLHQCTPSAESLQAASKNHDGDGNRDTGSLSTGIQWSGTGAGIWSGGVNDLPRGDEEDMDAPRLVPMPGCRVIAVNHDPRLGLGSWR